MESSVNRSLHRFSTRLSPIFDREKEQQRLQQAQLIGEIGNQVADIARTEGQIAGEKAKRAPAALNQARAELEATGKPFTEQDVAQRAYNNGMAASGFGTGGKYQQAIQAATAAVQGLAGGNLSAALAGGAAPYIAEIIKNNTPDGAGRVAAHAVVNAALAVAQGNNALAGAAGAATGEVVGMIATQMYGKPVRELSETEKQTVSTLATVAAGLAGGLVGDSGASAVAGAQSGKTTVENNTLGKDKIFDINPMLKIGIEDVDGELLKGGGGIAKGQKPESNASAPMGSKQNQMNQPKNPSYQPVRNQPAVVNNRDYTGHALDRMQDRGITPTVVENVIKSGISTPSRGGTTSYYDSKNNISVVTNSTGKVVTVKYGK